MYRCDYCDGIVEAKCISIQFQRYRHTNHSEPVTIVKTIHFTPERSSLPVQQRPSNEMPHCLKHDPVSTNIKYQRTVWNVALFLVLLILAGLDHKGLWLTYFFWCWRRNISALGINTMPSDALAPKVTSASAGMVSVGCVGQTTCIVIPELISSTWIKPNPKYDAKCEYIFCNH